MFSDIGDSAVTGGIYCPLFTAVVCTGQGEQAHPEMAESCEVSGDEEMSSALDQAGTSQLTGSEGGGNSADDNDEMQDQCESAVEETEAAAESVRADNTLQPPYSQVRP